MKENGCVLAVLDPTVNAQPAARKVALLAAGMEAQVELFVALYDQFVEGHKKAKVSLSRYTTERYQSLADELSQIAPVQLDVRWERPIDATANRKVEELSPIVVVKDTLYHSALRRTIFSNTDWDLIRTCPAPLWLAKEQPIRERPHFVAAVDPMCRHDKPARLDHRIVALGRKFCDAVGGRVTAVHVFNDAVVYAALNAAAGSAMGTVPPLLTEQQQYVEDRKQQHQDAFDTLLGKESMQQASGQFRTGDPVAELVACAEELEADCMLTGAVSRNALERMLIGQTAEQVLDRLPCDLLVVKPIRASTESALRPT